MISNPYHKSVKFSYLGGMAYFDGHNLRNFSKFKLKTFNDL